MVARSKGLAEYRIYGLELDLDDGLLPEIVKKGLSKGWYERDEVEIIQSSLEPGDRVLELGAGLGVTAMAAAGIVGAEAVRTYEANLTLIPSLRANTKRNGLDIVVENKVLLPGIDARREQGVLLDVGGDFWSSSVIARADAEGRKLMKVPTGGIEDELARHGANVLIMDIEGLEVDIIERAQLDLVRKLIFEIHYGKAGRDRTDDAIFSLVRKGFRIDFERARRGVILMTR